LVVIVVVAVRRSSSFVVDVLQPRSSSSSPPATPRAPTTTMVPQPPSHLKVMMRPGHNGSRTSLITLVGTMPIIAEDDSTLVPDIPPRSPRRISRMHYPSLNARGSAGHFSGRPYSAPSSLSTGSGSFPDRKTETTKGGLSEKAWLARRGGWKRIGLIVLLVVILAVGLGVGLALGLRKK
jgi:hypothetical protein